jgi:hypothetical protein
MRLESAPHIRIPTGYDYSRDGYRPLSQPEANYLVGMIITLSLLYFLFFSGKSATIDDSEANLKRLKELTSGELTTTSEKPH